MANSDSADQIMKAIAAVSQRMDNPKQQQADTEASKGIVCPNCGQPFMTTTPDPGTSGD